MLKQLIVCHYQSFLRIHSARQKRPYLLRVALCGTSCRRELLDKIGVGDLKHHQVRSTVTRDIYHNSTNLERLQLALFGDILASPSCLRVAIRLHARFKLVDLLPPSIELFSHVRQFFGESRFSLLGAFIKV